MRLSLLDALRCPTCAARFDAHGAVWEGRIAEGELSCTGCGARFPIADSIPRFVPTQGYADNFGIQWNVFRATQLDSRSQLTISRDRFLRYTGWNAAQLRDRMVLDAGCGAGRFAEIAHSLGGRVVAVDYSNAIDAARANLSCEEIDFVQADINALPFDRGTFPFVYCLGVIQHTPSPAATFKALAATVAPGGKLAMDVYPKFWRNLFFAKYWLRPLTRRLDAEQALRLVRRIFPPLYILSRAVARIPVAGHYLKYLIPVSNYHGVYPLSEAQHREWALLDTYDMWAPAHDQPQTLETVNQWFADAGFSDVETFHAGFFVGRGTKPVTS